MSDEKQDSTTIFIDFQQKAHGNATMFIDFHKKHSKTLCFSVVSRPAGAQVPIFTAQMKKASKKRQKNSCFFDFSNHAGAQVPIFTPKMKKFRFARPARLARLARLSTRKWDFRHRSRPRELAQRSQDDVSLNKLPQIKHKDKTYKNQDDSRSVLSKRSSRSR